MNDEQTAEYALVGGIDQSVIAQAAQNQMQAQALGWRSNFRSEALHMAINLSSQNRDGAAAESIAASAKVIEAYLNGDS